MSKRTHGLARRKADAYDTPAHATTELMRHLLPGTRFIEPCAGKGDLIRHLEAAGHFCIGASDIDVSRWPTGAEHDGLPVLFPRDATARLVRSGASCVITNPPWTRSLLHPIIENLSGQLPTWLLFDADWIHNSTVPKHLIDRCERVVAQGRVRWMEGHADDKGHGSVDNVAWYRFDATHTGGPRVFNRRGAK
jgi:hypothetical protein